jgi:hypothetical protein
MHTNGGCNCLRDVRPTEQRLRLLRNVHLLVKEVQKLQQELENAKHDIERLMQSVTGEATEVERLRALLRQAPIAKVTIREGLGGPNAPDDLSVSLYAPGLPPGEHDLYLMPSEPTADKP